MLTNVRSLPVQQPQQSINQTIEPSNRWLDGLMVGSPNIGLIYFVGNSEMPEAQPSINQTIEPSNRWFDGFMA
jgi:hypothetical protein